MSVFLRLNTEFQKQAQPQFSVVLPHLSRYCMKYLQNNKYPALVIPILVGSQDSHQAQGLGSTDLFNRCRKPHIILWFWELELRAQLL